MGRWGVGERVATRTFLHLVVLDRGESNFACGYLEKWKMTTKTLIPTMIIYLP